MRLNAIIPSLGMVALSVCAAFAGNGGGAASFSPWTKPAPATCATAFFEQNLGRVAVDLSAPLPPTVTLTETHTSACTNQSNGTITVTCTGYAPGALTFNLSGTNYLGAPVTKTATDNPSLTGIHVFTALKAGFYTVTVTASNGTSFTPTPIAVLHPPVKQTAVTATTSPSCPGNANGTITITQPFNPGAPNMTPPLPVSPQLQSLAGVDSVVFRLTSGPSAPLKLKATGSPFSKTFTGLLAGTYAGSVEINGCGIDVITGIIVAAPTPVTASTISTDPVTCFGYSDGKIRVQAGGGTGPYTFQLGASTPVAGNNTPVANAHEFTGIVYMASPYSITVFDSKGCSATTLATVGTPTQMVAGMPTSTPVSCFGGANGTATFSVSGGSPGYSFNIGTGPQTVSTPGPYQVTFSNLTAGTKTCTITDSHGCTVSPSPSVYVSTPPDISLSVSQTNVSCFGGTNGAINLSVSGGTAPYTFSWSNSSTNQNLTGLAAGTFQVFVTDFKGCTKSLPVPVTITQPAAVTVTGVPTPVSCFGGNNGAVSISITGGTGTYTIDWAGTPTGDGTTAITNLTTGSYAVTVTDINNCTGTNSFTVSQPLAPLSLTGAVTNVSCFGGSNGSIDLSVTGGTSPYTYDWDNNGSQTPDTDPQDLLGLVAGTYVVTVTDFNGCSGTLTKTVSQPSAVLSLSTVPTDANCFGEANGSIALTVSGGTPGYTYAWSPGNQTSQNLTGVGANTYTVLVTDANGCSGTSSATVGQPTLLVAGMPSNTSVSCSGGNDGTATFSVTGGSPGTTGYTFNIGTASQTDNTSPYQVTFTNLTAGTTTCTISDSHNCATTSLTTVGSPASVTSTASVTNVDCFGNSTGSIVLTPSGGTPGYTYAWSPGNQTTKDISGLAPGTYTVDITDSHSCLGISSYTISQPVAALNVTAVPTHVSCNGGANGTITVTATGGTPGYNYAITGGGSNSTGNFIGLSAGSYNVIVTDAHSCTKMVGIQVGEPFELVIDYITHTDPKCHGDHNAEATVHVIGGTAPYNYAISGPTGTYSTQPLGNPVFTGLTNGSYTVIVTDWHGCSATLDLDIDMPDVLTVQALAPTPKQVSCFGANDGAIDLDIDGGTGNYSVLWIGPSINMLNENSQNISGLAPGTYTVVVHDANMCTATASYTITQPAGWSVTLEEALATGEEHSVSCFGYCDGDLKATLTFETGTPTSDAPPFTYQLYTSPGGVPVPVVPVLSPSMHTATFTGLPAGSYYVVVNNQQPCSTQSAPASVTQPFPLTIIPLTITPTSCNDMAEPDGSIKIGICGGTNDNGLTPYEVMLCDANGLPSPYATENPYLVTGDCYLGTAVTTFAGFIGQGGFAGMPTSNVTIVPPNGTQMRFKMKSLTTVGEATLQFTVPVGYAQVRLLGIYSSTDPGGVANDPLSYTVGSNPPVMLTHPGAPAILQIIREYIDVDPNVPTVITVKLATTVANAKTATFNFQVAAFHQGSANLTINNLPAGDYIVKVTDANDCTGPLSMLPFTITEPLPISICPGKLVKNVTCNGGADGSIELTPTGGTPPYTYVWSDGQTTNPAINLEADPNYFVTVTDFNGCTATNKPDMPIAVTEPPALDAAFAYTQPTCHGDKDGAIDLTASGGTAPYYYDWNWDTGNDDVPYYKKPDDAADTTHLGKGTYTLTLFDGNGCSLVKDAVLGEPATLVANLDLKIDLHCHNYNDGEIHASATGGTPQYTFILSGTQDDGGSYTLLQGPQLTVNFASLEGGMYTLNVIDAHFCSDAYDDIIVRNPDQLIADTSDLTVVSCLGGEALIEPFGGTKPYTIRMVDCNTYLPVMPPMDTTGVYEKALFSGLGSGTFCFEVNDANDCGPVYATVIIAPGDIKPPVNLTTAATGVLCSDNTNGTVTASATGGSGAGFVFKLYSGAGILLQTSMPTAPAAPWLFPGLAAGTYSVVATDVSAGCTVTKTAVVTAPPVLVFSLTADPSELACHGDLSTLTYTITGGIPFPAPAQPYLHSIPATVGAAGSPHLYTVTDANGCTRTATVTITEPTLLVATATPGTIDCHGGTTTIVVSASGGSPTYTGTGSFPVHAGDYSYTVTDAHGCMAVVSGTITEPDALEATVATTGVSCHGSTNGSADVTNVTGGTPGYQYSLDGSSFGTATSFTSLASGSHYITVKDSKGCTKDFTFTIGEPDALQIGATYIPIACNGNPTTVLVTANGGTQPYHIKLDGNSNADPTDGEFTDVPAGLHNYSVKDANGCSTSSAIMVTEPDALEATASALTTALNCNGLTTTLTASATGGTGSYGYQLNGTGSFQASSFFTVGAGTYTITVRDANALLCTTITNTVTITQPAPVSGTTVATQPFCNGGNGSITLTPSGGTPGYTFLWSNGATTQNLAQAGAGTYTVIITDAHQCTGTATATITPMPPAIVLTPGQTNVSCNGGSNGTASVSATGGTGGYTYVWSNGGNTASIGNLTAGTYTVTVYDANGCPKTAQVTLTQPPLLLVSANVVNGNCTQNGSITAVATGGTGVYTYLWSTGAVTPSISPASGSYSVTVTDANGCTKSASATINNNAAPVITGTATNPLCNGGNGSIQTSVTGGTPNYIYAWTGGATSPNLNQAPAGTYVVTVTDANQCTGTTTATITAPSAIVLTTGQTNVSCNGGANGTASVSATGGTGSYTYAWSNGGNTGSIGSLTAGTYTVTVYDANGCPKTAQVTITQPGPVLIAINVMNGTCSQTGSITATPSGGSPGYSILWSNGATTASISPTSGSYSVTVTDLNGCTRTASATISNNSGPMVSAVATNPPCNNGFGSVQTSVTGGTPNYQYAWTGGATTPNLNIAVPGTYVVTVTDFNQCTGTATATITNPAVIAITFTQMDITCNGLTNGSATASATGGTGTYIFNWSNGVTNSATISGLAVGAYTVTVYDANGCSKTASVSIVQPPVLIASATGTNVSCNGGNNGTASVSATGGTAGYTYLWSTGATTASISGLTAGTYSVTATDAKGCQAGAAYTVTQPTALTASTTWTNVSCNGGGNGTASVSATGGTQGYTYLWSTGATTATISGLTAGTYSVIATDSKGCTATGSYTVTQPPTLQADATYFPIACFGGSTMVTVMANGGTVPYTGTGNFTQSAGSHTYTVTDANGCSKTVVVEIVQPTLLTASTSATPILCIGGSSTVTVSATGGTPTYTGTGTFTRTAGTYSFTVYDLNGCSATATVTITEPTMLALTETHVNATCGNANGSIDLTVSGGTQGYTYDWSNDGPDTPDNDPQDLIGLAPGTYTVTVTDANGCSKELAVTIGQSPSVTLSTVVTNVLCNGGATGAVNLTVNSGNAPFTYLWSNQAVTEDLTNVVAGTYTIVVTATGGCTGTATATVGQPAAALLASASASPILCMGGSSTVTVSATGGTAPYTGTGTFPHGVGSYSYTVTDFNGCQSTATGTITEPTMLALTETHVNATCGNANGSIDLTVSGGTPGYTYDWSNDGPDTPDNDPQDLTGLAPGTYTVTVTDANGCSKELAVTIGQSPSVTLSTVVTNVLCNGGATGAVNLTVNSGTAPFTYLWSNQAVTEDLTNVVAGTYTVVVTATGGCTGTATATVGQPTALVPTASAGVIFCNGGSTTMVVSATGGTSPYSGTGNFPATGGFHSYTVTDANGCTAIATVSIAQPSAIVASETHTAILCNGGSSTVVISAQGGTGGLVGTGTFSQAAGTHVYTVSDENNCSTTISVTVTQPAAITVSETHGTILCNGGSTTVNIAATGGTGTLTGTGTFPQAAGTHVYTVSDANGCTKTISVTLTQPGPLSATASASGGQCGAPTGCITVSPTGGTPGYQILILNASGGTVGQGATTQPGGTYQLCQLPLGQYSVIITDFNGCTSITGTTIIGQPAVTVSMTMVNVKCFGESNGSIDLTTTSGTAPFTYAWSPGGQTSQDLTNIPAGNYSVTVTDGNGCSLVKTASITQPPVVGLTETHANASCGNANGSITLAPSGGTAPYSFTLNGGASQTNSTFSNLAANTYNAVVTDANGCTKAISIVITQTGSPVQIVAEVGNVFCFGNATGSITLTASGGTAPYMYRLLPGAFGTSNVFTGLTAGTYTVEAKDANGCIGTKQVIVAQPVAALGATAVGTGALCAGASNGSITVTATGGTPAYQYKLGNGAFQNSNVFPNLAAGTYVIVVKDANNCDKSVQATVQQPSALTVTTTAVNATCNGLADGKIGATATGGTPAYQYKLAGGNYQNSGQFNGLAAGTYVITAKDANGCTVTTTATVGQPQAGPLGIVLNDVLPVSCPNGTNGAIYVTVSGCGPFVFTWRNASNVIVGNAEDLVNVPAGTYSLFVIDGGGLTTSLLNIAVTTVSQNIQNLAVENNTTCAVTLTWSAVPNTDGYEVRFKPCNATNWTAFNAGTATTYTFTNLTALTCYDFCVRFSSEDCFGAWTCITGLTTPEFNPPINTSATVNSNSSATIKWAQSTCSTLAPANVELRYKKVSDANWTVITLSGSATSQTLNNLMPNTCYQYRLRNRFVVGGVTKWSNFTPTKTFCLPVNLTGGGNGTSLVKPEDAVIKIEYNIADGPELDEQPSRDLAAPVLDFTLFPNPTSDFVNLRFTSLDASNSLTIRLLGISGQLISEQTILDANGIADQQLDVNRLPQGFYLIEVSNGALHRVEKFVKQ